MIDVAQRLTNRQIAAWMICQEQGESVPPGAVMLRAATLARRSGVTTITAAIL
jgi:hypothetical protein